MVYIDALGVYYHFSKDPAALAALDRAVKFHSGILWSDGSSAAAIDERVIYEKGVNIGNIGFSYTPEGRGFILSQLAKAAAAGRDGVKATSPRACFFTAARGRSCRRPPPRTRASPVLGKNDAVVVRAKPWEWAFSAYATPPIQNRWIQDRQNHIDIFHARAGPRGRRREHQAPALLVDVHRRRPRVPEAPRGRRRTRTSSPRSP